MYKQLRVFGGNDSEGGLFDHPWGISLSFKRGLAFVCDWHRVQAFKLDGEFVRVVCEYGKNGSKGQPTSVLVDDSHDEIFITDAASAQIQVFELNKMTLVRSFGSTANLFTPFGMCMDGQGMLYVSNFHGGVAVFTREGTFSRNFGSQGTTAGQATYTALHRSLPSSLPFLTVRGSCSLLVCIRLKSPRMTS